MTHRPQPRPLPVHRILVGTPGALPTLHDWASAGEVSAPDPEDAAYQAAPHLRLPAWCWVREPEGRVHGILVTLQGGGR